MNFYDQETEWISDLDSKQWSGFIFQRSFSKIQPIMLWKLRFNWSYLKALADNNWPNMKLSHSCCFKLGNLIPGWQTLTFFSIVSVNTASGSHYCIVHPKTTLMEKLQLNSWLFKQSKYLAKISFRNMSLSFRPNFEFNYKLNWTRWLSTQSSCSSSLT